MSEYVAKVNWVRDEYEAYVDNKYSRAHQWTFDGGLSVAASSSPQIVPLPYSVAANVDPEEAFIASLSSCHMLFFLSIAAKAKFVVDAYEDNAIGLMETNLEGNVSMTVVTLKPKVTFSGRDIPSVDKLEKMHHQAHQQCFIANSVKTKIVVEVMV